MQYLSQLDFESISNQIESEFGPIGLEHYPFKVFIFNLLIWLLYQNRILYQIYKHMRYETIVMKIKFEVTFN